MREALKEMVASDGLNQGIAVIRTNLYEIIEAVGDAAAPDEDPMIPVVVNRLLNARSRRLRS